jgi:SAM-dependent methyltransferase
MSKFSPEENKEFWNDYSKKSKNNPFGAHSDKHVVDLENNFILNILEQNNFKSLLDVGCGNGQRTLLFSKHIDGHVKGIDYSEEMILEAKKLLKQQDDLFQKKISFDVEDVNNIEDSSLDVILSCRCLINQPSSQSQINTLKSLYTKLKTGGSLIIAEQSLNGIERLNDFRKKFDLPPITIRWYNVPIDEKVVFPEIDDLFKINSISRLGVFYYVSRVLNPALVFPDDPNPNSKINELGKKTELVIQDDSLEHSFEQYGAQLLVHFIKK